MIRVNDNFRELPEVYLFTQISRILDQYRKCNHRLPLIRMDIGDVAGPLPDCVTKAMHKAVDDLATRERFKGYGPEQGYLFLRELIAEKDYVEKGIRIDPGEIFISDGAKCDLGNLGDIISKKSRIGVMDPSYPAYIDDNVIDGRAGKREGDIYSEVCYLKCCLSPGMRPELPLSHVDVIYLCSPNNPTGTVMTKKELKKWVDYAHKEGSLIIFDSAYVSYIRTEGIPKSIYEIEGAREVAIEVRSFSKTGGFTGIRCGYSVIPVELKGIYSNSESVSLNSLWSRRQTTKFNGASYVSQCGASALYTEEGRKAVRKLTDNYLGNARLLREFFETEGWEVYGGTDSPYVWAKNPWGRTSYEIFNIILERYGVSTTPGSGFGREGDGYIRLTGFNTREKTEEAINRMKEKIDQPTE